MKCTFGIENTLFGLKEMHVYMGLEQTKCYSMLDTNQQIV
ncbi:hypothetical protein SAMN06265377_1455 [Flagellimonas pacifica]|uniref:Uncharacterized protein n=1 Tax=Flagellimonas pacifica TaxID=1247520 RepID=A0A285MR41_9FLAO|nr:hypothetical protein SAMN06265377_1455 [Allomuricauda parva]